jgi:hypothetical protein
VAKHAPSAFDNAGRAVFLDQPAPFHDLLADFVKRCS